MVKVSWSHSRAPGSILGEVGFYKILPGGSGKGGGPIFAGYTN